MTLAKFFSKLTAIATIVLLTLATMRDATQTRWFIMYEESSVSTTTIIVAGNFEKLNKFLDKLPTIIKIWKTL